MAKKLSDILGGVKSSKKQKLSLGSEPGVDYAPKSQGDRDFVADHEVEVHADRVGNGDEVYKASKIKRAKLDNHGHVPKPKDSKAYKKVNEAAKFYYAHVEGPKSISTSIQAPSHADAHRQLVDQVHHENKRWDQYAAQDKSRKENIPLKNVKVGTENQEKYHPSKMKFHISDNDDENGVSHVHTFHGDDPEKVTKLTVPHKKKVYTDGELSSLSTDGRIRESHECGCEEECACNSKKMTYKKKAK